MRARFLILFILLAAVLPVCSAALAEGRESAPVVSENITARLVAEPAFAAPGTTVTLAFAQDIREGWHTYWRNPGDSGAPADLTWELPEGVEIGPPQWPTPEAIPYFGMMTYGHHDRFVLLHDLTIPEAWPAGKPVPIRLAADWLVCAEICIPEEGHFALDLETVASGAANGVAATTDSPIRDLLEAARAELPKPSPWPVTFNADVEAETLRLRVPLDAAIEGLTDARFFPYEPALIDQVADPVWRLDGQGLVVDLDLQQRAEILGQTLAGVLVLSEDLADGALRQAFTVAAAFDPGLGMSVGAGIDVTALGLLETALLALLGGILLNLMPCVFPILSIKTLALVQHAGSTGAARQGLAYTAGVLVTFLALAGLLIALQAGGALIGWGFQLQEPLVVALLAYLMFVLGLWLIAGNEGGMLGLGRIMGLGDTLAGRDGLGGSFATGVLAVFVASPCTAPFMAGAIGFALTQSALVTLVIFAALGLGLALPYLALSTLPWLQRRLPRPGPWMVRFRQFMAFPMFATAAWLVWVLAQQAGDRALLLVLLGFVALALAAWTFRLNGRVARITGVACLAAALLLAALPGRLPAGDSAVDAAVAFEGLAEPFAPERLDALRAEGRPVFVNMTAAWCLTCLVNENAVLAGEGFAAALARNDAVYLKGDWTRRDPVITAYLERFGRAGVPLYVVYPASGEPVLLPQILTKSMVRDALDDARNMVPF